MEPFTTWSGVATMLQVDVNSKGLLWSPFPQFLLPLSPQVGTADARLAQRAAVVIVENFMLIRLGCGLWWRFLSVLIEMV